MIGDKVANENTEIQMGETKMTVLSVTRDKNGIIAEYTLEKEGGVVPLEVKAGNTSTPSLNAFIHDFGPSSAYKLVFGNQGYDGIKRTLPHYMVMFL